MIKQTRFLVLYFCVANLSERIFTLEQIFVEKMFVVIFISGNILPYSYLISCVFNFMIFVIVKKSRN